LSRPRLGLDRGADALGFGADPDLLGLLLGNQYFHGLAPLAISLSRAVTTRSALR
jgi:hypothetical protein